MKRRNFMVLALCIVLCFSVMGCSGTDGDSSEKKEKPPEKVAENIVDDYKVTVDDWELTTDYEGKDALEVSYTFTNNGEKAKSFEIAIYVKAFQDGIELGSTVSKDYDFDDNGMKDVQKGKSIRVKEIYLLDDTSHDVDLEITAAFSFKDDIINKTIKLK